MKKDNNPIRIAHIMGKWLGGGVESVVMNYYRNINHNKIQFDFICDADSTDIPYDEIKKLGGKVIIVSPYQKIFKYIKELTNIFKMNNYKIVHSHINTLSVFPLYAAKKANVPIRIAHSHSTTSKLEWKKNLLKQILRKYSKLYSTHYMCCGENAGKWQFGSKLYNNNKVYLLRNAIDIEKFEFNNSVRHLKRKELNINDDTIVLSHVGRFVSVKNHKFIIDVFNEFHKLIPNSVLVLAGKGPLLNQTVDLVDSYNLNDSVLFIGQRNDLYKLYQAFDVFLLPSLYEGLPVVGIEAQTAGLLCVFSTNVSKEAKIIETTKFISLSESPKYWAKEISDLLMNFKRKKVTHEVVRSGYSIKNEVRNLEEYYYDLIDSSEVG